MIFFNERTRWITLTAGAALLGVFIFATSAVLADSMNSKKEALNLISETANKICGDVPVTGSAQSVEVNGKIDVQLKGLASKLAEIGINGSGSITSNDYSGVLREQLADTIKNISECKLKVFESLEKKLIVSLRNSDDATNYGNQSIPGDTGWIFVGYFNIERGNFIEGPYVSVISSPSRVKDRHVTVGDRIKLNVSRTVFIVDFKKDGVAKKLSSPITKGVIGAADETDIILAKGTELIVRDVKEGHGQDNPNAALWVRVINIPK
jgi:hypothetical protein